MIVISLYKNRSCGYLTHPKDIHEIMIDVDTLEVYQRNCTIDPILGRLGSDIPRFKKTQTLSDAECCKKFINKLKERGYQRIGWLASFNFEGD